MRLQRALLALAADALSGPGGLAAYLRATLATASPAPDPHPGTTGSRGAGSAPTSTSTTAAAPNPTPSATDGRHGNDLGRQLASVSLPLDAGTPTETIPAHLRRLAAIRHPHCAFPGCEHPASVCEVHHLVPRAQGGPTALHNLVPLCRFHHLVVIHRWGWTLTLNPDGTTTATSPDGARTLHSHGKPSQQPPTQEPPGRELPGREPPREDLPREDPPGHAA